MADLGAAVDAAGYGAPGRGEAVPVDAATLRAWPLPEPGSDKHSRGVVLVVGGSAGTPGAVRLAGEAALRAGAGKLQLATVAVAAPAVATAVPEAMVRGLPGSPAGNLDPAAASEIVSMADQADVALLGTGAVDAAATVQLLEGVVPGLSCAVVVDALGSAFLTEHPDGLRHLDGRCVLTVNPTETMLTLRRRGEDPGDLAGPARELAATTGAVVLCGGPGKVVATPEGRAWRIGAGGPGLGVAGSGDVQAGLVAGLLARGAEPVQAAVWAGWLHGTAGERLAAAVGSVGFLARELAAVVPGLLDGVG